MSVSRMAIVGVMGLIMALGGTGCIRIKSDPVEVKPIEITVNVNVRMEKELQDIFGDLDAKNKTLQK